MPVGNKRHSEPTLVLPPSLRALLGAEADELLHALADVLPVSVRYNPLKPSMMTGDPVPWCAMGRYLPDRPLFTLDPLLHAGCYYVQEASSMLVEQAIAAIELPHHPIRALDMCAAPGGKSTHLATLLPPDAWLVCNEPVPSRRHVLAENVWKHGRLGVAITGGQPSHFAALGPLFDLVLVDAPCSGQGMFRKDPFARTQWTDRLSTSCAAMQSRILADAWTALKPGGRLIYSTCTWEPRENEERVEQLLGYGGTVVPIVINDDHGVRSRPLGHRCYPHRVKGEGFFIAVVRKPGKAEFVPDVSPSNVSSATAPLWLKVPQNHTVIEESDHLSMAPIGHLAALRRLKKAVPTLCMGTPAAERKGVELRPHAALALAVGTAQPGLPDHPLDRPDALAFLRGEIPRATPLNDRTDQSVRRVTYEGHGLGWLHRAGSRWNNGLPKAWRIRMR